MPPSYTPVLSMLEEPGSEETPDPWTSSILRKPYKGFHATKFPTSASPLEAISTVDPLKRHHHHHHHHKNHHKHTTKRRHPPTTMPPTTSDDLMMMMADGPYDSYNVPLQQESLDPSMSVSEDSMMEIATTAKPPGPQLIVRTEEVGIVLVVLLLWVGAIVLFFNRWGKIRMLEPYQPKFCESHRPSCPMAEVTSMQAYPRTYSKFNISTELMGSPHFAKCTYHGISNNPYGSGGGGGLGLGPSSSRPRQNSVFVTSPHSALAVANTAVLQKASRKTKSAIDLSTLVLSEEFLENEEEQLSLSDDSESSAEAEDQLMELQRLKRPRVSLALEGEIICKASSGKRKTSLH